MSETYGYDEMMADFALLAKYKGLLKAGIEITLEQQVIFNAATDRLNAYDAELKVSGDSIWKWWDPDSYVNYDPHVTVIIGEKREVTGVALNVAEGLGEALMDLDKGIYNTVAHPIDTAKNLGYAIWHPIDTGQALYDRVSTSFKEDVIDGNTDTRARFGARALAELGIAFIGTKGLDKTSKILRVNKGTAEVLNTLDKGSRKAFDLEAISPLLKTEPNKAYFWSGKTEKVGGAELAAKLAETKGGTTLESLINNNNIKMPEYDFNNPASIKAWEDASAEYAKYASGEIRAVIGKNLREGNIWENIELPLLRNNPNVTKITVIDPKTGIETVIFER